MGYILKRNPDFSANILKVNRNNNPLINETLLQMKYARVIGLLAKQLKIPHSRALEIFIVLTLIAIWNKDYIIYII